MPFESCVLLGADRCWFRQSSIIMDQEVVSCLLNDICGLLVRIECSPINFRMFLR